MKRKTPKRPNATIIRTYDFEAAHRLPFVDDGHKCKTMHGHSYTVRVQVTGPVVQTGRMSGMVVDFGVLDDAASRLRSMVDHTTLNETLHDNPTVENMAPLVWDHFRTALTYYRDLKVRVWLEEGPRSCAVYPPEKA